MIGPAEVAEQYSSEMVELYTSFQKEVYEFVNTELDLQSALDISSVRQRPGNKSKSLESIIRKVVEHNKEKKGYPSLFEINDIAGVRVVGHCEEDVDQATIFLEGKLKEKYKNVVLGEKDQRNNEGKSSPSYRAKHLTFSKEFSIEGVNRDIFCEIQLRTVMADAWAVQDHKYVYGKEVAGEAHDLTGAVAKIMEGCESLWSLVKERSLKPNVGVPEEFQRIVQQNQNNLRKIPKSLRSTGEVNNWFNKKYEESKPGLKRTDKFGFMEVRAFLTTRVSNFEPVKLKDAARDSTIHTFGWPIAVFLEGNQEFSPKPDNDGIKASIFTNGLVDASGHTFDFWSIRTDGSFYLIKTLFEDTRKPENLFFDTRIIQITETLLYLKNLYTNLGVDSGDEISVTIKHGGLTNRTLSSASTRRELFFPRQCYVADDQQTIRVRIADIHLPNIVDLVGHFTKPLFGQFDFFILDQRILEEIVSNYVNGKIV